MNKTATVLFGLFCAFRAEALPINALQNHPGNLDSLQSWMLPDSFTANYDFEGIVALNNCSGSLVRFEGSSDSDAAMVLTNGHCVEGGFMKPGQFVHEKASKRAFTILDKNAKGLGSVKATEIMYGTMTKSDMAIYRLEKSIGEIRSQFKVAPLTLSKTHTSTEKTPIEVISGYWKRGYTCAVSGIVHMLKEADWTWEKSIRYTQPGCETIGGTSGSPIVERGTRTVIGVNNTGNESGQKCTMNNPCEVDEAGNITYKKGISYGQQIADVYGCLNGDNEIDLELPSCKLHH